MESEIRPDRCLLLDRQSGASGFPDVIGEEEEAIYRRREARQEAGVRTMVAF